MQGWNLSGTISRCSFLHSSCFISTFKNHNGISLLKASFFPPIDYISVTKQNCCDTQNVCSSSLSLQVNDIVSGVKKQHCFSTVLVISRPDIWNIWLWSRCSSSWHRLWHVRLKTTVNCTSVMKTQTLSQIQIQPSKQTEKQWDQRLKLPARVRSADLHPETEWGGWGQRPQGLGWATFSVHTSAQLFLQCFCRMKIVLYLNHYRSSPVQQTHSRTVQRWHVTVMFLLRWSKNRQENLTQKLLWILQTTWL